MTDGVLEKIKPPPEQPSVKPRNFSQKGAVAEWLTR